MEWKLAWRRQPTDGKKEIARSDLTLSGHGSRPAEVAFNSLLENSVPCFLTAFATPSKEKEATDQLYLRLGPPSGWASSFYAIPCVQCLALRNPGIVCADSQGTGNSRASREGDPGPMVLLSFTFLVGPVVAPQQNASDLLWKRPRCPCSVRSSLTGGSRKSVRSKTRTLSFPVLRGEVEDYFGCIRGPEDETGVLYFTPSLASNLQLGAIHVTFCQISAHSRHIFGLQELRHLDSSVKVFAGKWEQSTGLGRAFLRKSREIKLRGVKQRRLLDELYRQSRDPGIVWEPAQLNVIVGVVEHSMLSSSIPRVRVLRSDI
ncbi:hypothetical protein K438DRAFT_1775813 [Mycena galopus ATCC 62051]|nr:hypothetical protein K438DRAFT_1775813 [Mycena galopus ATCC 62051]